MMKRNRKTEKMLIGIMKARMEDPSLSKALREFNRIQHEQYANTLKKRDALEKARKSPFEKFLEE